MFPLRFHPAGVFYTKQTKPQPRITIPHGSAQRKRRDFEKELLKLLILYFVLSGKLFVLYWGKKTRTHKMRTHKTEENTDADAENAGAREKTEKVEGENRRNRENSRYK